MCQSLGDISTIAALDHETSASHSFTVTACDQGNPVRCSTASIRIIVSDFNDQVPTFDQNTYTTDVCFSGASVGTELVQPVATDGDSGTNAELRYLLMNSPVFFSINEPTGRISVNSPLSSNEIGLHSFTIVATDMGDTPLSGSAEVEIRVLNCSEHDFYFLSPFHYFEIDEGENRFADNRFSLAILLSGTPSTVSFIPDPGTNPFTNVLNVSQHTELWFM